MSVAEYPFRKLWNRLRPISDRMGYILRHQRDDPWVAAWLSSSSLRYFSGVSHNSSTARPTACAMHLLERESVCGSSGSLWSSLQRWRLRSSSRPFGSNLQGLGLRTTSKMGRRFLCGSPPTPVVVGRRFHSANCRPGCSVEHTQDKTLRGKATLHWLRVGSPQENRGSSSGEVRTNSVTSKELASARGEVLIDRSSILTRKTRTHGNHFWIDQAFRTIIQCIRQQFPLSTSKTMAFTSFADGFSLDRPFTGYITQRAPIVIGRSFRRRMVGRCELLLWHRSHGWQLLGCVEVGTRLPSRSASVARHWMGRGHSGRTRATNAAPSRFAAGSSSINLSDSGTVRQRRSGSGPQQRTVSQRQNQCGPHGNLLSPRQQQSIHQGSACFERLQHNRCPLARRYSRFLGGRTNCYYPFWDANANPFGRQADIVVMPAVAYRIRSNGSSQGASLEFGQMRVLPSPLRPDCRADERIFQWKGVNTPPDAVVPHPALRHLMELANRSSLRDTTSYGSGLRKFHIFCDVFSIEERDRLPASFATLHSFVLWAASSPSSEDHVFINSVPFEPVATEVATKYLSAVRAWHIAQGWPPPLSSDDMDRINWSIRGLARIQGGVRTRPPRPPVTLHMLASLGQSLNKADPFEACIWAIATCAFWGCMRFGEATVQSRATFSGALHLKRRDVHFGKDLDGKGYARLDLPSAKTAKPGEIQQIFLTQQGSVCPLQALQHLFMMVPAVADDPLFSWTDKHGMVRPMIRSTAMSFINTKFTEGGWGTAFGHSFRIGGASFYLSQGVDPEIVRLMGRWKSLAYETYIRAFEQVASRHTANLASNYGL